MTDSTKATFFKCRFLNLAFQNPFLAGAGTFGHGVHWNHTATTPSQWGGVVLKGVTPQAHTGHLAPRMVHLPVGMINAVGLDNPGWDTLVKQKTQIIKRMQHTNIIVNLNAFSTSTLLACADKVAQEDWYQIVEVNFSCPNTEQGGLEFGRDPQVVLWLTQHLRKIFQKHKLVIKISGVIDQLVAVAKAVESGGADAISLINTVPAMLIDAQQQRPVLGGVTGGLSGAAIKPIALRAVYLVYQAVQIPIIGMGGISSGIDAVEFLLAGAQLVQLGTILWKKNFCMQEFMNNFMHYFEQKHISHWQTVIGHAH